MDLVTSDGLAADRFENRSASRNLFCDLPCLLLISLKCRCHIKKPHASNLGLAVLKPAISDRTPEHLVPAADPDDRSSPASRIDDSRVHPVRLHLPKVGSRVLCPGDDDQVRIAEI